MMSKVWLCAMKILTFSKMVAGFESTGKNWDSNDCLTCFTRRDSSRVFRAQQTMPLYFPEPKIATFYRQLVCYGFKKACVLYIRY